MRVDAIDIARALAIIGVVFNHSIDGMSSSGFLDERSWLSEINQALYVVRMPALAFLLGLFIPAALSKRGPTGYLRERLTFAIYIYVIWFFIQMIVEILTSSLKNNPRPVLDLIQIWSMPAHLWFLPYIAVSTLVIVSVRVRDSHLAAKMILIVIATVSVLAWGWNPNIFGLRGLSILIFTALGAHIGLEKMGTMLKLGVGTWCLAGGIGLVGFLVLYHLGAVPGTQNVPREAGLSFAESSVVGIASAGGALLGIVTLLAIAAVLSRVPFLRTALQRVGRATLPIYLAHILVVSGTRIALEEMGVTSIFIVLTILLGLGLILPILLLHLTDRWHHEWLFHVPGLLGTWSRAANSPRGKRSY